MTVVQGRWLRAVAVAMLVVVLGCTDDGGAPNPGGVVGSEVPGDTASAAPDVSVAPDARITLERQLGHHTMLVIDAMRAPADDTARTADVRRVLQRSTDRLSEAVAEALDTSAEDFRDVWVARVDALLALAGGDQADADLRAAQDEYGSFIAGALDERLAAADATAQLAELDDRLARQLAEYRDGELANAFAAQREAFATAFHLGRQLVVAAGVSSEASTGAVELRSALQQLLGEHTLLAVNTARRTVRGRRDARYPAAALNGNTEDLTAALLSIYDEQAAVTFDEHWRDAIAALMQFTAAATELDDDARRAAVGDLRRSTRQLAEQLASMTEQAIDQQQARKTLTAHFRLLRRHSAAIADNRFRRASNAADEAYAGSEALADLIASGIAEHRADEFSQR